MPRPRIPVGTSLGTARLSRQEPRSHATLGALHDASQSRDRLLPTQRHARTEAEFSSTRRLPRRPHVDAFASRLRHPSGCLTAVCLRDSQAPRLISVLAYHLLCWINKRLEEHSDTCDWQTIRRLLGTHSLVTTRLPLADGRTINIRKPSQPDDEQKHVCQMLDIDWKSAFPTRKTEIPA